MASIRSDEMSIEMLRDLISACPDTGALTWRRRSACHFQSGHHSAEHQAAKWNSRFAGKPALTAVEVYGYLHGDMMGKRYKAHRVVWALHYGAWPDRHIDHINGDPADNRICNLRLVSPAENMRNQKINAANTSGVMGVSWAKHRGKWSAQIKVNRRKIHLGLFDSLEGAARARKNAEVQFGFHPNHGRAA